MPHSYKCTCLFVKVQDGIHHKELFLQGDTGVVFMECILLKKTEADHAGNLQHQLLVIRQDVASDQFYDLQQTALLVEEGHQAVAVVHKLRRHIILIPVA